LSPIFSVAGKVNPLRRRMPRSLLLSAGHSLKAVSSRLGHAKVEVTLKVYAHVMPGDDDRLTAGIGEILKAG
jgi:integrase